jgi:prevent-host-death family protein
MANVSIETCPLDQFEENPTEVVSRLRATGHTIVLTVDGNAAFVVQDAASYRRLCELAEQTETVAAVRESMAAFDRGEGRSAREALEELRSKYAIPRDV